MKDLIRKILKESEDEFEWTKDVISSSPSFEIGTFLNLRGKLFKNLGIKSNDKRWFRWSDTGCHKITGKGFLDGEECYIIYYDQNNTQLYFKKKQFNFNDVRIRIVDEYGRYICKKVSKKSF